uniref:Uncharacterized protein n=1 Tax=Meloidogyne hapla TaxID=6305 RepID=A0A1I8C075_MELHA
MNISIILFLLLLITPIFRGGPRKFIRGPPGSGRGSQRQEDQHEDDAVGGGSRTGTSNQGNTRSGDTTTGTNHQDVATGSGMPSSQGEPQQNPFELQGLGDPFFNIQFDPSFQPFPVEDYYPPIYPPSYYQINQPAQQTNPTFFENENFNIWPENKRPKQKGSQKERAFKKIKELGYTLQEIEVLSFGNKIRGKCNLCKDYNEREFGFEINNQKGVEECIDNHVNSQNHQLAMEHIKKPGNNRQKFLLFIKNYRK